MSEFILYGSLSSILRGIFEHNLFLDPVINELIVSLRCWLFCAAERRQELTTLMTMQQLLSANGVDGITGSVDDGVGADEAGRGHH